MNRQEFLQARKTGIGGSDIGAILGVSPFKTAMDVYIDKTTSVTDAAESPAMYWGTVLEPVVADEYKKRTERKVQRINQLLRHPDYEFAIANIDRAVINPDIAGNVRWKDGRLTTDRILECKTANGFAASEWGDPGTDYIPDTYLCQVQWYMGITGCEVADLAVLIGGNDFRTFTIEKDDDLFFSMLETARVFWANMQKGIAPTPQSIEDAQRKWPRHQAGKSVVVDVCIADLCQCVKDNDLKIKAIEEENEELKKRIMAAFGDAEQITFGEKPLATWKNQTAKRFDSSRFKEEQPDLYNKYLKETETRVLRFKK